jgi:nitrogen fixation protein NifB
MRTAGPDLPTTTEPANCKFGGGCGDGAQLLVNGPAPDLLDKARNHPCYSEDAHHHFARMHVAVAPACNIQCNYCNRKFDCANESRPGVVSERLTPGQAIRKVLAVAAELPNLAVVGIAGPGDPLADPDRTFAALAGIRRAAPDLTLCLSTNGLALPDHVDELVGLGVGHVTVTVNAIDPDVGARIHPWIFHHGRKVEGREAARILSQRQLAGIAALRDRGVLVKVNSVVVPGVNDAHLPVVSRAVRALGAFVHNVMPLIALPEHGTRFGLEGRRGPTAEELEAVQEACAGGAKVMRHCRQCRADAVGLLGEDRHASFPLAKVSGVEPEPAALAASLAGRSAHRRAADRRRARVADERDAALAAVADVPSSLRGRIAVATRGDGLVNQHFGHAREFLIYDVSREGATLVGLRKVEQYCRGGEGEERALDAVLGALRGCDAVLVAKIGHCPKETLAAAGVEPVDRFAYRPIDAAALEWFAAFAAKPGRGGIVAAPTKRWAAGS